MNDTISPSITTSLLGIGAPGAGTGLLSTGESFTGLNGVFAQLLAQSAPGALPDGAGGQTLPMPGASLPQSGNVIFNQVLASLERLAGGPLPDDFLQQVQQYGFSTDSIEQAIQMLENSPHSKVPAIGELIGQFRQVLKERSLQSDDSDSEQIELPESTDLIRGEEGVEAGAESAERSAQTDSKVLLIQNVEVAAATQPNNVRNPEAQPAEVIGTGSISTGESQQQVKTAESLSEKVLADTGAVKTTESERLERSENQQTFIQSHSQFDGKNAKASTNLPELDNQSSESDITKNSLARGRETAEQRVINADIAALIKQQQSLVAASAESLESDAEQLMTRLNAAAQSAVEGASSPKAALSSAGAASSAALVSGSESANRFAGPSVSKEDGAAGQTGQLEQVRQLVSQLTKVLQPADVGQVVPSNQPAVAPQVQVASGNIQASSLPQSGSADVDVSPEQAVAAINQLKTEAAEDKRTRREPAVIINADGRSTGDGSNRPPSLAPIAQLTVDGGEVVDAVRTGVAIGDDAGGRESGSNNSVFNQPAAATASRQSSEQAQQPPLQFGLPGRPALNSPGWPAALGNQMVWLASQNNKVAEIQLDPPELGSLQVKIRVSQDQVSVSFVSPHASVRDTVEQSIARLRDMFEEQGLNLADASVADQSTKEHSREREQDEAGPGMVARSGEPVEEESGPMQAHSVSLVDYYA